MPNLFAPCQELSGALFSDCGRYRYKLHRKWGRGDRWCAFICLNPSTADETKNDPTVERLERRARSWGYDGLYVVNLFAFRATDPRAMKAAEDPVGPDNNMAILEVAAACGGTGLIVCAWGTHGTYRGRDKEVYWLLTRGDYLLHYLKLSKDGIPCHPLYLGYDLKPTLWWQK
jgi:hypothetical protein